MNQNIGKNALCPCGSGKRYKRCCLLKRPSASRFPKEDRESALAKLTDFAQDPRNVKKQNIQKDFDTFWQGDPSRLEDIPEERVEDIISVFHMWWILDRVMTSSDGTHQTLIQKLLASKIPLKSTERIYLTSLAQAAMRLYEVTAVTVGTDITFRDVLSAQSITVAEQTASRSLHIGQHLACRINLSGPSGRPEIEQGILDIPFLVLNRTKQVLTEMWNDFLSGKLQLSEEEFRSQMPFFFFEIWLNVLQKPFDQIDMKNNDGHKVLMTKVFYSVKDRGKLVDFLENSKYNHGHGVFAKDSEEKWIWLENTGQNDGRSILGSLNFKGDRLTLETNSAERAEAFRKLLDPLTPSVLSYETTVHEDLNKMLESFDPSSIEPNHDPAESAILEELERDFMSKHYDSYLDIPIPALANKTPREAAKIPKLRSELESLIRGLEGFYQKSLAEGRSAYDPSWMWDELGLKDAKPKAPPPLAHERWATKMEGWQTVLDALVQSVMKSEGFDEFTSLLPRASLDQSLLLHRLAVSPDTDLNKTSEVNFLKNHAIANNLVMTKQTLKSALNFACNHEILRRKTFWVDDSLVFMLSQTTFDPQQVDLKLPFAAFALVFTDRKFLSLAESMLSKERDDLGAKSPLCGFILQCATIYINEKQVDSKRVIELGMAFDTLGADLPDIVEHTLVVEDFKITGLPSEKMIKVKELDGTMSEMPQISLRGQLLHLVLNAVMYSTSAEIDIIEIEGAAKKSNQDSSPKRPLPTPDPVVTSDRVFYLPGKIDIIEVRKMKRLERAPQGGKLLYRFMVRGHWRRPAKSWADKRPRWIQPFWKGPDLAAVIERSYRLRSD